MSLSGTLSPFSSSYAMPQMTGPQSLGPAVSSPYGAPSVPSPSLLGQQAPSLGGGGSSALGGSPMSGNLMSMMGQIVSMIGLILQAMVATLGGGGLGGSSGGGSNPQSPGQSLGGSLPTGGDSSAPSAPNYGSPSQSPSGSTTAPSPETSGNGMPTAEPGYSMTNTNAGDAASPSPTGGNGSSNVGQDAGWNKNVNVYTSSNAGQETVDSFSGGKQVGGYLSQLEDGMDQGKSLTQAHDGVHLDNQTPMRNNASPNSLVKGKGGNAVVVTGDNIGPDQANQFADKLRKDYGMNVKVIPNSSPNQLKAALQEMGQQKGQQAMVAVLAHGAKDDSGKNDGDIALGKGDGDQWLHESDLKSMVNQYVAPSYGNVNVVLNSCFSGNFVQ